VFAETAENERQRKKTKRNNKQEHIRVVVGLLTLAFLVSRVAW
jgi:hypothetical protein